MLWLVGQIAVFLLIAVVLGFVIGWLLRTLWPSSRARSREGELQTALERATARISDLEAGLRAKRAAATAAAEQEQAALRRVEQLQAALDDARRADQAAGDEQERLRADLEDGQAQIASLRERISDLEIQAATLAAAEAARDAARARADALEAELARSSAPQRPLFAVPEPEAAPGGEGREDSAGPLEPDEPEAAEPEPPLPDLHEEPPDPGIPAIFPVDGPTGAASEDDAGDDQRDDGEPAGDAAEAEPEAGGEAAPGAETALDLPGGAGFDNGSEGPAESPEEEAARLEQERLRALEEAADRFRLDEPVESDDLREIYGVGPALERLLHSMNIYTFAQIANFTEDDVELVSTALGRSFPDRITRDDWIGSARGLHRQKYGEEPPAP